LEQQVGSDSKPSIYELEEKSLNRMMGQVMANFRYMEKPMNLIWQNSEDVITVMVWDELQVVIGKTFLADDHDTKWHSVEIISLMADDKEMVENWISFPNKKNDI
jgi:hypothetical protein